MSSKSTLQALTDSHDEISASSNGFKWSRRLALKRAQEATVSQDILLFLIAFRILNAFSIKTFFQPDEYFQALEPAWQIAFGEGSGAWITWEWRHQLRPAIHPTIFAVVYWVCSSLATSLGLSPTYEADFLIAAPKIVQAIIAALGDYYTWKLAQKVYSRGSNEAWAALALTVSSPWQWFCSTRTFSNCFETTLTIIGLFLWPWHWSLSPTDEDRVDNNMLRLDKSQGNLYTKADELARLRCCLLLAATACVLRPTNLLIWMCLSCFTVFETPTKYPLKSFSRANPVAWLQLSSTKRECQVLVREIFFCGSLLLALSALVDRLYYQAWTFPSFRFLYFNIVQSLAVLYGKNDWHYYASQGYPLLLATFLPFAIHSLYRNLLSFRGSTTEEQPRPLTLSMKWQLTSVALLVTLILSFVSHKEVRFIYPVLPILHTLAAESFTAFFIPAISPASPYRNYWISYIKKAVLVALLAANAGIAIFATRYHQPAPLLVLEYLREQHEHYYLTQPPPLTHIAPADTTMTVGFLMPCHSTPWRSHLVHPGIKSWALGCEPPIGKEAIVRKTYVDEADQFYDHPTRFLAENLGRPPRSKGLFGSRVPQQGSSTVGLDKQAAWDGKPGNLVWPEYIVFFEQLERTMGGVLEGSAYDECWRGWNSWFHDDWRRRGDILVYCLRDKEKAEAKGKRTQKVMARQSGVKRAVSGLWR